MKEECDIDDGDGTGELANAKNRESPDLNVETVTHVASGNSRDGRAGTRHGTAGTGEPHTRATTTTLQGSRGRREGRGRRKPTARGTQGETRGTRDTWTWGPPPNIESRTASAVLPAVGDRQEETK